MKLIRKTIINRKFLIVLILVLAFILRFYRLDSYPALNADEASIGYNAYSLIQTGLDEHGNPWPIHFQSFNDYKPGLYFYLVLPFVKLFGLNETVVRFPNAALSVLTVLVVYLLTNELFVRQKGSSAVTYNPSIGLIASLLLAINPWHIQFSRGGWEVNTATFFMTTGLWLFIKFIRTENFANLLFAVCSLVLSLYTYHAVRVVLPLMGIGVFVIYYRELKKNYKLVLITALIGFIFLIPLAHDLLKPAVSSRAAGVGLFADPGPLSRINEQRGEHGDYQELIPKVIHNKIVNYLLAFMENWSAHYHGEFLFLSGDLIERDKVPETGQMYLFDFVFISLGFLYLLATLKSPTNSKSLLLLWLFIAPTASALTFQSPSALRAQNMVIPLVIICALGIKFFLEWITGLNRCLLVIGCLSLVILTTWQFVRYQHMYWIHMSKEYPLSSQYGVKELVNYITSVQDRYDKIIVTDRYDQPYILFLFYMKYSPAKFQKEHELTPRDNFGFSTVRNFDKFNFEPIEYDITQPEYPNSLLAGTDKEIPKEANIVRDIFGSNGYRYFRVVAN